MLKANYVEDTRPLKSFTLVQPKGTLDLTINKNAKGTRLRISNTDGNTVNVAVSELGDFVKALNEVAKRGVNVSQRAAA